MTSPLSTLAVDPAAPEAPYEQVRRQIAAGASDGTLSPGHRLPTVRQLATDLGLAATTVARAYRELEADGVVETHGRRGTFVASRLLTDTDAMAAASEFVQTVRRAGLSREEALRLVEQQWSP